MPPHRRFGREEQLAAEAEFRAALLFQRIWHRLKARRRAARAATAIYEKYIDADTGRPYWCGMKG